MSPAVLEWIDSLLSWVDGEWINNFLGIIISWPAFAILALCILKDSIRKFLMDIAEFKIANFEFKKLAEHSKITIKNTERINELMAESRIIEIKIFLRDFGERLTEERRQELETNLEELEKIIKK